ncbi:MAG: D-alanyl-D-alanine carboxypeptidase [Alphaproteobacteria bacterium]
MNPFIRARFVSLALALLSAIAVLAWSAAPADARSNRPKQTSQTAKSVKAPTKLKTAAVRASAAARAKASARAKAAAHTVSGVTSSAIVVDAETGEVLHAVNPDAQTYPASLTKMMTLYLTFEALRTKKLALNTPIYVSDYAAQQSPTKLNLEEGDTIMVEDAILGLVTKSANDAAVALAEELGGSESAFAQRMTRKAQQLGMENTVFQNASGLPNRAQVTTARDMVILARALHHDFPERYHYFSRPSFSYHGLSHNNHNHLLGRYQGVDGIKTGFIRDSGYNLAASAERDGRRIFAVVLGGHSAFARDQYMVSLLNKGFQTQPTMAVARAPAPARPAPQATATSAVTLAPLALATPAVPAPPASPPAEIAQGDAAQPRIAESVLNPPGEWGVQVGAFQRYVQAQLTAARAARIAPELLGQTTAVVVPVEASKGQIFRARLMGLSTKENAEEACRVLIEQKMECRPINAHDSPDLARLGGSSGN